MKRILLAILFVLMAIINANAQDTNTASGTIRDAFLKVALPGVKMTLMAEDSTVIKESISAVELKNGSGEVQRTMFYIPVECGKKYHLRASLEGYDDAWLTFKANMMKGVRSTQVIWNYENHETSISKK